MLVDATLEPDADAVEEVTKDEDVVAEVVSETAWVLDLKESVAAVEVVVTVESWPFFDPKETDPLTFKPAPILTSTPTEDCLRVSSNFWTVVEWPDVTVSLWLDDSTEIDSDAMV